MSSKWDLNPRPKGLKLSLELVNHSMLFDHGFLQIFIDIF